MSAHHDITSPERFQRLSVEAQARARNALYFLVSDIPSGEYPRARLNVLYHGMVGQHIDPTHARALLDFLLAGRRGLTICDLDAPDQAKAAGYRASGIHWGSLRCNRCGKIFEIAP